MIRKLVRQMLSAQIFSALAVSLCLLIDIVVIGQYLGKTYMETKRRPRFIIGDRTWEEET